MRRKSLVANLRVGRARTSPARPTHVRGVRQGNQPGSLAREAGIYAHPTDARFATATAERSTGINPRSRDPIDPSMPNLPPA